jgi:predicted nucleic acid-binding protein
VIVLDASCVVELLLRTQMGDLVAERIAPPVESLHAPHLLDIEVLHTLRRYALKGQLTAERADQAVDDLTDLGLERYSHDVLARRIWELRGNATAYDAAYLALAEALGSPLLTCDTRLREIPGVRARVEVLG